MRAVWLVAWCVASAAVAGASPVSYDFVGTVTEAGESPVAVGRRVAISVTLDASFADDDPSPELGSYQGYGEFGPLLAATIAGQDVRGLFTAVTVRAGGGASFDVVSGTPLTDAGFSLHLSTPRPGVLPGDAIPATLDPARFETATFSRTLSLDASHFAGTIAAAAPVPAPGSLPSLARVWPCSPAQGARRRGGADRAPAASWTRRRSAGFIPRPDAATPPAAGA